MPQTGKEERREGEGRGWVHACGLPPTTFARLVPPTNMQCEEASHLPSIYTAATPASQNEQWNRLTNDPLLLVGRGTHTHTGQFATLGRAGCHAVHLTWAAGADTAASIVVPLQLAKSCLHALCIRTRLWACLQIKKQQQQQLRQIRENPVKMMEILKEVRSEERE